VTVEQTRPLSMRANSRFQDSSTPSLQRHGTARPHTHQDKPGEETVFLSQRHPRARPGDDGTGQTFSFPEPYPDAYADEPSHDEKGGAGIAKVASARPLFPIIAAAIVAFLTLATPLRAADTLVYFDSIGNQTLDPVEPQSNSSQSQGPLMAIYDTLVALTDSGEPKPGLAKAWHYNQDLTVFTLELRPGVLFHDGEKLTADAVARNLRRTIALGSRTGAAATEAVSHIAEVEIQGDNIVRLKLKTPNDDQPGGADRGSVRRHVKADRCRTVSGARLRIECQNSVRTV